MAASNANSASSSQVHLPTGQEDVGLINGQQVQQGTRRRWLWYGLAIVTAFILVAAAIFTLTKDSLRPSGRSSTQEPAVRNVILMISDGFGPASETFARSYHQYHSKEAVSWMSPLDKLQVGASRTRSSNSLVTDSAAGATAFSCALKSYNGAIGVDPEERPCGTVLEAAKDRGMLTGLVATSRITHATPGAFSAHVVNRDMEDLIASYQIGNYTLGRVVDLMLGGGKCHFVPATAADSCRSDNLDLIQEAEKKYGFTHLSTKDGLLGLDVSKPHLPLLGLFSPDHMDYEIDRDHKQQPSLREMSEKALGLLREATNRKEHGFFLMIEGSRIDMAAHANDPATHVHEVEAYWNAVSAVKDFVDANPGTVMISVSDHETGGLTLGRQLNTSYPEYLWHPDVLAPVQRSMESIALALEAVPLEDRPAFIRTSVMPWLGMTDLDSKEFDVLKRTTDYYELRDALSDMISRRALVGWTTHGHTGVDVNLYAYGTRADRLRGNHENTDVGSFIAKELGLDLDAITKRIRHELTHQSTEALPENFLYRRSDHIHELHYHHMH
ncbi:vacuolar alkaline phosphatase [Dimargaris xerosporica]|nr:vacuolar alkaline phosphatase [Dimargaris xerosporica]